MAIISTRSLYRAQDLTRTFAPRSIAVVGVSTNPSAFGSTTYTNIVVKGGFAGTVWRRQAESAATLRASANDICG